MEIEYTNPSPRMRTLIILQVTSRPKKVMKESKLLNKNAFLFWGGYFNYFSLHLVITLRNSLKFVLKCASRKGHQTKNKIKATTHISMAAKGKYYT